ncbi:MAG: NUDIX hydrolase [Candidatus Peribacteraceae bacterium]|jgi:8-oxo-dGTP pyrophosphatase MutT (NUDIX family)|nr:NUDIX hydrolase [Candidatus Peribacteraceae bacterium]
MSQDIYRSCASIVVFRPSDTEYQVLLVHKPRKNDAWQLPQGGVEEGESLQEAALREVHEEAGITPEILDTSDHVYQYDFPKSYRRFRPDNVCGQKIEYIFARAEQGSEVTVDDDEIDEHAWVLKQELPQYLKRKEYLKLVEKLFDDGVSLLT